MGRDAGAHLDTRLARGVGRPASPGLDQARPARPRSPEFRALGSDGGPASPGRLPRLLRARLRGNAGARCTCRREFFAPGRRRQSWGLSSNPRGQLALVALRGPDSGRGCCLEGVGQSGLQRGSGARAPRAARGAGWDQCVCVWGARWVMSLLASCSGGASPCPNWTWQLAAGPAGSLSWLSRPNALGICRRVPTPRAPGVGGLGAPGTPRLAAFPLAALLAAE